ncbi:unnamed protein product [Blepharisma stoltei]|uniref:Uncharacterized protein n=1 Tax=Blepharisma stoltei TaxID=1481888 RepID=A0AAU9K2T6_9CILI|nr:unnamed protein product [Blepharisma stoltei]
MWPNSRYDKLENKFSLYFYNYFKIIMSRALRDASLTKSDTRYATDNRPPSSIKLPGHTAIPKNYIKTFHPIPKENPNSTPYTFSHSSIKSNSDKKNSRPLSALPAHEETKNKKDEPKRKEASTNYINQSQSNNQWTDSKKVNDINRNAEKGTNMKTISNPRENRREELKSNKPEAFTVNMNIETANKESIYDRNPNVYQRTNYNYDIQERQYEHINPDKTDSTSLTSYETALLGQPYINSGTPQEMRFLSQETKLTPTDNKISSIIGGSISENQRFNNSLPKSRMTPENFDKTPQNKCIELEEENRKLKEEILNLKEQIDDINQEKIKSEKYNQNLQNENFNYKNQLELLNSQLSKYKEDFISLKLEYENQWSQLNKEIIDLKDYISRLEKARLEDNEKYTAHVNNLNAQKKFIEAQHSDAIWKLNNEKSVIEGEKVRLEKQIEDLKATYRIMSKSVVRNEKEDNSKQLDMELKKCQKEIEDYKFQLRNSGPIVKVYHESLIASLEEQITELANLNSQLENDLSAANMKLRQHNIY